MVNYFSFIFSTLFLWLWYISQVNLVYTRFSTWLLFLFTFTRCMPIFIFFIININYGFSTSINNKWRENYNKILNKDGGPFPPQPPHLIVTKNHDKIIFFWIEQKGFSAPQNVYFSIKKINVGGLIVVN